MHRGEGGSVDMTQMKWKAVQFCPPALCHKIYNYFRPIRKLQGIGICCVIIILNMPSKNMAVSQVVIAAK